MSKLSEQINCVSEALSERKGKISSALSNIANCELHKDCYTLWHKRIEKLSHSLRSTEKLLRIRENALSIAKNLNRSEGLPISTDTIHFVGIEMDYALARHLAISSYLTISWTIYDRLSNVCGRLVGTDSVAENEEARSNPKLCGHFFTNRSDKKKEKLVHGFSLSKILPAYEWPVKVSYLTRNWLIHEGLELDGVPLFSGNNISDGFILHDQAIDRISKDLSNENIFPQGCCLKQGSNFPWYDKNILTILEIYHSEVDTMFVSLLKWSVDSFIGQVEAFTERDKPFLATIGW